MNNNTFSAGIMAAETLEDLAQYLSAFAVKELRTRLFDELKQHVEYEDADQWAVAVRLCESLAIVGWGELERVDAVSHFNGDCWNTRFINGKNQSRFREGSWSKRKAGWVLRNPSYHLSPDLPDTPGHDWQRYASVDFPAVACASLPSQRNYQAQMPVIMGMYGSDNPSCLAMNEIRLALMAQLYESMRPAQYGENLEYFYFTLHGPAISEESPAPHLKVANYNANQRSFSAALYFDQTLASWSPGQQRKFYFDSLLAAIDALEEKLRKRGIEYDTQAFRADVTAAIQASMRAQGE
ncbi:hypothetical protein [Undibacterium pigrum]|uniref:Uncharacterized protein n=1 Tax=Undibacterium pigrum TaxID=401470 RepID=A0A318JMH7_9BURK|nr:hypothetical protein [Undibacterium pigrum]PXX45181.1 hypothetical protein DFR42_102409 [Undibacterium pigrum]